MKNLILIFISLFIFSCNNDQVSISKDEYNRLKNIKVVKPEYPKTVTIKTPAGNEGFEIYLGSDGHEYQNGRYSWNHYIECVKCKKQNNEKDTIH